MTYFFFGPATLANLELRLLAAIPPPLGEAGTMSQPGSPEQRPPDAEGVGSSPGTNQGDTLKKGRKKKGEKKPIPEMRGMEKQ